MIHLWWTWQHLYLILKTLKKVSIYVVYDVTVLQELWKQANMLLSFFMQIFYIQEWTMIVIGYYYQQISGLKYTKPVKSNKAWLKKKKKIINKHNAELQRKLSSANQSNILHTQWIIRCSIFFRFWDTHNFKSIRLTR